MKTAPPSSRPISVCNTVMDFPTELTELRTSNAIQHDPKALHARMDEDGYLMIRGFHDHAVVLRARERFLAELDRADNQNSPRDRDIARTPELMAMLESERLFSFWGGYFGESALTFSEKWLRNVSPGGFTGAHYDNVYMGRGSARLHTCWTPIGDTPMELGTLAICVGSHRDTFQRLKDTYGQLDVDRTPVKDGGWYTRDPLEVTEKYGGQWASADFEAGDAVFFPMFTLHGSTRNDTERRRLSCDIRFQPASDPADERWYGPDAAGHSPVQSGDVPTMEELKSAWQA